MTARLTQPCSPIPRSSPNTGDSPAAIGADRSQQPPGAMSVVAEWLSVTRNRLRIAAELLRNKPIVVRLFGDKYCFDIYQVFVARHPKFPLTRRKSFGAALRDLNTSAEALFAGPDFAYFRRRQRRAERLGYQAVNLDPIRDLEAIMRINTSGMMRQRMVMASDYVDRRKVEAYHTLPGPWYGIVDAQGVLRAYCHLPIVGECCIYSRILGDLERLNDGIMYLLVYHTVREMHRLYGRQGRPRWAMYDMFLGGTEGLRTFKRHAGFQPERVTWMWDKQCSNLLPRRSPTESIRTS